MKRIVSIALVIGLVMAVAPFASAQGPAVTGTPGEDRALGIQIYGNLDLQMRYMNSAYVTGIFGSPGPGDGVVEAAYLGSPKMTLGINASLADKAAVCVELEVPRIDSGMFVNEFGTFSLGSGGVAVGIRQANLRVEQLLTPDLTLTFGLQQLIFDLRGKGNPLLIAIGRSESAFIQGGGAGTAFPDDAAAGGLRVDYKLGDAGSITAWHMIVMDDGGLFGGGDNNPIGGVIDNELSTGVEAVYNIDKSNAVEALITLMDGPGRNSEVWLLGVGGVSNGAFVQGLDLFAQVGFNFGTYSETAAAKSKAKGIMFDVAADYTFDMAWKPSVGVEYLYVKGNKSGKTDEYAFVSYENNNDLVVLENKEFGFDLDQNYSVIKLRASAKGDLLPSPVKDAFEVGIVLGIAKLVEDQGVGVNATDKIGTELDVKASWMANKQVKVYTGIGTLFGSEVLKDVLNTENTAFTFYLGTEVKF